MRIGFIGAGKVGTSLGRYFAAHGWQIAGYYSTDTTAAFVSSKLTDSNVFATPEELTAACDWLFLTVPDTQIETAWLSLKTTGQVSHVFHCSGALTSEIFANRPDIAGFSLHPLLAFASLETPLETIAQASFTLEGDSEKIDSVYQTLAKLGNPIGLLASEQKVSYHAACVIASNFVVGLTQWTENLLHATGLAPEFAETAWRSLFLNNAETIAAVGPQAALTGPIERNDLETVKAHLAVLPESECILYRQLALQLVVLAEAKHPERDYHKLKEFLI